MGTRPTNPRWIWFTTAAIGLLLYVYLIVETLKVG